MKKNLLRWLQLCACVGLIPALTFGYVSVASPATAAEIAPVLVDKKPVPLLEKKVITDVVRSAETSSKVTGKIIVLAIDVETGELVSATNEENQPAETIELEKLYFPEKLNGVQKVYSPVIMQTENSPTCIIVVFGRVARKICTN